MSKGTLVREDWNDISKLTFKGITHLKIIEVKVIESFIGVKPFPVVVVIKTLANEIIARQYNIEGEAEDKAGSFQIVKVKEPEPVNYEEIVKELMIKGVFVSKDKIQWFQVTGYWHDEGKYRVYETWSDVHGIKKFYFSFDLENFYDFDTYLTLRGKS